MLFLPCILTLVEGYNKLCLCAVEIVTNIYRTFHFFAFSLTDFNC